jgi:hypothetical protein
MLITVLQWYGAATGTIAALIVSLDNSQRWTGFGFMIFVTSSFALIGVCRYLIRKKAS